MILPAEKAEIIERIHIIFPYAEHIKSNKNNLDLCLALLYK
jgi:hypothetical protein